MATIAQAIAGLKEQEFLESFDPLHVGSRPTKQQAQIMSAFLNRTKKYIIVRAGNQCLAGYTLVATPTGPIQIKDLKEGDYVYSEHGEPIKVLKTFKNGIKKVYDLTQRGKVLVSTTPEHVWQFGVFSRENGKFLYTEERNTTEIDKDTAIRRVFVKADLGTIKPSFPYSLGALLGDGCSREKRLVISGQEGVPQKVANELNGTSRLQHVDNYDWILENCNVPSHYEDWAKGRYAHEKIADISILKTWDRESLVQFVAGLLDTDGTCYGNKTARTIVFNISMQAKAVVEAFTWAVLALWQVQLSVTKDTRPKYKNGPVWQATSRNPHDIKRILEELQPHIVSTQKHWQPEWDSYGMRSRKDYVKVTRSSKYREEETYDIHVDSSTNLYLLANGMVTHNSGKSATGMKAIAVMLREDPNDTWKRPKTWLGPLLFLCLAKQLKQAEESLLPKLTRHLKEGTYRIVKQGNALNKLVMENGNTCLFFSHHNANQSRDAVQSFTAHGVMLDELPADPAIIEELDKRILVNKGSLLLTFTPKVPAPRVKNYLEALPEDRVLSIALSSLDNPSMDLETKEGMLSDAKARGEAFLNTILYGAWLQGERAVFIFNPDTCLRPLPEHYSSQAWRHMLVVDPASASSTGCLVAGEDPQTGSWFVIHGSYIMKGLEGQALVKEAEKRAAPYRITRRIYDSAASWFELSARSLGLSYMPVMNKANNKLEMIQGINSALGRSLFIVPEQAVDLEEELAGAQWSESARENIAHGHEYHLSDSLAYMLVSKPPFQGQTTDGQLDGWAQARLDERMTVISKLFKEDKVAAAGKKRIIQVRRTAPWR